MRKILVLSHSSRTTFGHCPKMYELQIERGLTTTEDRVAADFGVAVHRALAGFHTGLKEKAVEKLLWATIPNNDAEERYTPAIASALVKNFLMDQQPGPENSSNTESSLIAFVGTVVDVDVFYIGTLDLTSVPTNQQAPIKVTDYKTTALCFRDWWALQRVSDQWPGYVFLLRENFPQYAKRSVVIEVVYLPTRASEKYRYQIERVHEAEARVPEFKRNLLATARQIITCQEGGVWPHARHVCGKLYGKPCPWYDHCVLPEDRREHDLKTCGTYQHRKPSPSEKVKPLGFSTLTKSENAQRNKEPRSKDRPVSDEGISRPVRVPLPRRKK